MNPRSLPKLTTAAVALAAIALQAGASEVHAPRQRLACFGASAPAYKSTVPPTPSVATIKSVLLQYTSGEFTSKRDEIAAKVSLAAQPYVTSTSNPADWDAGGGRSIWTTSSGSTYQTSTGNQADLFLERSVPEITRGSWVVVTGDRTRTPSTRSPAPSSTAGSTTRPPPR